MLYLYNKNNIFLEEETHERETIFQLSANGYLRVGEKNCLTTKDNAYLSVEKCRNNDDKQRFKYDEGLIINHWSKFCVMQVRALNNLNELTYNLTEK